MKPSSKRISYLFIIKFVLIFVSIASAQKSKTELEKEKSSIQKQLKETQQILEETSTQKKASIGQLNAIKKQIESRTSLINTYSEEIKTINNQISVDGTVISALQQDLENLKKEYGAMVYTSYKASNGFNKLTFLFSSKTFNQFIMRFKYLEQYTSSRQNQVKLIQEVQEELIGEKNQLEKMKVEKEEILAEQVKEKNKLDKLKGEQNTVLSSLKSQESNLKKDIDVKRNEVLKLETLISNLVKKEITSVAAETKKSTEVKINLENLNDSFEKSKAKLPWPVSTGFITSHFGTHPHPVLKRIKVPNDGVNIQTKEKEQVKAVFQGTVKKVAVVPGDFKYVVIVQHGNYFTVYAKLREVHVKMGQEISINDTIGIVNTDKDGVSEVQFQVWKNYTKLDPELWLAKR